MIQEGTSCSSGTLRQSTLHSEKLIIRVEQLLPACAWNRVVKAAREPEPLKQSRPSAPARDGFPARQAFAHDLGHITPPQRRRATPSRGEIVGDSSEKPAIESDREIRRAAMAEVVGEPSVNELEIQVQPAHRSVRNDAHFKNTDAQQKVALSAEQPAIMQRGRTSAFKPRLTLRVSRVNSSALSAPRNKERYPKLWITFSTRLLSISASPCSRNRASIGHWLMA